MHPLYTDEEFKAAKSRTLLPLKCSGCDEKFYRPKRDISRIGKHGRRDTVDYCGNGCQLSHCHSHGNPLVTVACSQCQKPIKKKPSQIKASKSGNHFCCKSCAAKWNNAHKKHGTRRSKFEQWLEEQLTALYPDLEIHFNRKDAIESELDIFIPSLRLAFELNGIFHYEPIYGQDKLDTVQSNDQRKFAACHEAGIGLCSVDVSHQKYFKPKSSQKFLGIITGIIDTQLSDSWPALPVSSRNHVEVV